MSLILPKYTGSPTELIITPASESSFGLDAQGFGNWAAGAWPTANLAIYIPFQIQATGTAYKMFVPVGATAAGHIDLGIYDASGNQLVHSGAIVNTTPSVTVTADITDVVLAPGRYFMAMSADTNTDTFARVTTMTAIWMGAMGAQSQATAYPLPSTATFAAPTAAYTPIVGVQLRLEATQ